MAAMRAMMIPRMDASESETELRIAVEMPGVAAEDIEVALDDDILTIRADKNAERKDDGQNAQIVERTFQRVLQLPFHVTPDNVKAGFENGAVTLVLPKPAGQNKARRIKVQAGSTANGNSAGGKDRSAGQAPSASA